MSTVGRAGGRLLLACPWEGDTDGAASVLTLCPSPGTACVSGLCAWFEQNTKSWKRGACGQRIKGG